MRKIRVLVDSKSQVEQDGRGYGYICLHPSTLLEVSCEYLLTLTRRHEMRVW